MRLIDRDEVMKKLSIADECEDCPFCSEKIFCGKQQDFVDACEAICDAPVVEIIHCKDCKSYESGTDELPDFCKSWGMNTSEDGYCHNAERKKDAAD